MLYFSDSWKIIAELKLIFSSNSSIFYQTSVQNVQFSSVQFSLVHQHLRTQRDENSMFWWWISADCTSMIDAICTFYCSYLQTIKKSNFSSNSQRNRISKFFVSYIANQRHGRKNNGEKQCQDWSPESALPSLQQNDRRTRSSQTGFSFLQASRNILPNKNGKKSGLRTIMRWMMAPLQGVSTKIRKKKPHK